MYHQEQDTLAVIWEFTGVRIFRILKKPMFMFTGDTRINIMTVAKVNKTIVDLMMAYLVVA